MFKRLVLICTVIIFVMLGLFQRYILLQKAMNKNKLNIVCTTNIIADAITHIAQDKVNLDMLMGAGVDPHLYKPIEQDITKIAHADIIFYNGLHLEARMSDLFANMSKVKTTVAVTRDMPEPKLIRSEEHEQYFDPHVWFNPHLWLYGIETITNTLQKHDVQNFEFYEQNKDEYIKQINIMYQQTLRKIKSIPKQKRVIITAHDAFAYFAQAYNCLVVSLQGISTASEAGTKDVQDLANFILKHKIPAIFLETSIPPRAIQAVQQNVESKGLKLHIGQELYSDALGSLGTEQGTYIGMMRYNITTIFNELTNKESLNE